MPVSTLDDLVFSYGEPAFVKIDTEGFEADILRGLSTDLADCVFPVEVRRPEDIPGFAHLLFQKG